MSTPLSFLNNVEVKARTLSSTVADKIQDLIVSRQFGVGDRLPSERDLATMLAVSRNVVREATKILAERGLVTIQSGSGVYVTAMEPSVISRHVGIYVQRQQVSIGQLYETRWILEVKNARLAALKASPDVLSVLEQCIDEGTEHLSEPALFSSLDVRFHKQLAIATGNPILPLLLETITDALRAQCHLTELLPGAQENAQKHHVSIFNAVQTNNPEAAEQAMASHLRSGWEWLRRALSNPDEEVGDVSFG